MCLMKPPKSSPVRVAASDNLEATKQADTEARLRLRRRGAAANIHTSPAGIPSGTPTMGGVV